jgi:putative nucleotidyltransferase with HDIG domain
MRRKSVGQKLTEQLSTPQTDSQRHLEAMVQVSRALGTIRDMTRLIPAILKQVTHTFCADRSSLFLYDETNDELCARVAEGLDEQRTLELRLPANQGVVGQVFQTHANRLIADTRADKHFATRVAESTGYVPRSMMVCPVFRGLHKVIGVIQVLHQQAHHFHDTDMELLEAIAVQVAISLENAQLYEQQKRQFSSFVRAFSTALDARDPSTQEHSLNVANLAQGIGYYLDLPFAQLDRLRVAGLLHDVGKIGTPEAVLKKPGKLDPDEFAIMKEHAAYSLQILSKIEFADEYDNLAMIASLHHEKLDGTGYPFGLKDDALHIEARILAVADIYHAMTQDRVYRKGMRIDKAIGIIDSMTPHQLDQACVNALKRFLGQVKA